MIDARTTARIRTLHFTDTVGAIAVTDSGRLVMSMRNYVGVGVYDLSK